MARRPTLLELLAKGGPNVREGVTQDRGTRAGLVFDEVTRGNKVYRIYDDAGTGLGREVVAVPRRMTQQNIDRAPKKKPTLADVLSGLTVQDFINAYYS